MGWLDGYQPGRSDDDIPELRQPERVPEPIAPDPIGETHGIAPGRVVCCPACASDALIIRSSSSFGMVTYFACKRCGERFTVQLPEGVRRVYLTN